MKISTTGRWKWRENHRASFLKDACAGDRGLQEEVERLLAEEQQAGSFLEEPAFEGAARELAQDRPAADLLDDAAPTQLGPGAQLGPYRIEAPLGAGGMGEVFRAVDTRLGRNVAIKVSAQQFSGRFDREARAISALNHPHICTLYDVGPNYLRHGVGGGRDCWLTKFEEGPLPMAVGAALRGADRRRTRGGACAGNHSSRSEAGKHHGHQVWRESAGLRSGEDHRPTADRSSPKP